MATRICQSQGESAKAISSRRCCFRDEMLKWKHIAYLHEDHHWLTQANTVDSANNTILVKESTLRCFFAVLTKGETELNTKQADSEGNFPANDSPRARGRLLICLVLALSSSDPDIFMFCIWGPMTAGASPPTFQLLCLCALLLVVQELTLVGNRLS